MPVFQKLIFDLIGYNGLPWWLSGKEPACQGKEMQVCSLGWENPLEEEMATHSHILGWEIPWMEKPGGCSPWVCKKLRHDLVTERVCMHVRAHTHTLSLSLPHSPSFSPLSLTISFLSLWPNIVQFYFEHRILKYMSVGKPFLLPLSQSSSRYTVHHIMFLKTSSCALYTVINAIFEHWVFWFMPAIHINAISRLTFGILMNGTYFRPFSEHCSGNCLPIKQTSVWCLFAFSTVWGVLQTMQTPVAIHSITANI